MPADPVHRRLAAILAADVAGYSRLMGADEEGTRARFNGLLDEILRPAIDQRRGRIVKTMGDGLLVEFASVVDAVLCAADIQGGVAARQSGEIEERKMLLRIGIHLGDVMVEDDDIHGDGVNIAARLEGLAEPGGICVSDMVHSGVRGKLALAFNDLGDQSLKNIAEPIRVFQVVRDRTAEEAAAATDALFRRPAVAVLPFENISNDPDQEYFADGLTEDIITTLSLWRSFPVIARNSTFAYKGQSPDIRKVGEELGARYVIEGSVRRSGSRMRVTAQLINAETGHHVWAERYDRDLEDVFSLQDELTSKIAATVAPELERSEHRRAVEGRPRDLGAWDQVQRGMACLYEFSEDGNERAREAFDKALAIDPNYGRAYVGLAWSHNRDMLLGFAKSRSRTAAKAVAAGQRAVELDRTDSFAHMVFGIALTWAPEHDQAIKEFERAIELNPNNTIAHHSLGHASSIAGRPNEGIIHLERGLQLNPKDPRNHLFVTFMAQAHLTAHRYEEAVDWAEKAFHLREDHAEQFLVSASALGHLGRLKEARAQLDACERLRPGYATSPTNWYQYKHASDTEHFLNGLRKAGWKG